MTVVLAQGPIKRSLTGFIALQLSSRACWMELTMHGSALRMAQLYVRGDDAFVHEYIGRALGCDFASICLTVDSAVLARRDRDIGSRYRTAGLGKRPRQFHQAALDWKTVKRIKDSYKITLVLKGIATVEDARIAVDHGVDWIYVSNHGGRQLDHGRDTMDVLPEIVDAVAAQAKLMVDGGFCRGSDIVRALAIDANLVGIGRMQCYALAAGGEAAIIRMLELMENEILWTMALLGVTRPLGNLIGPTCIRQSTSLHRAL